MESQAQQTCWQMQYWKQLVPKVLPGIMKLRRGHPSCSRWNLKEIVFSFIKKRVWLPILVGNWALYLPFFSYITCPLHLLCDQEKLALTFLSKNTRVEKSAGDSCNKNLSILSLKGKTTKYTTLLFFLNLPTPLHSKKALLCSSYRHSQCCMVFRSATWKCNIKVLYLYKISRHHQ